MAPAYKMINNHVRIYVTSLCLALAVFFLVSQAQASDPIFTVEGVEVDVTAENAIAASEKAFEEAQIKAFEELSQRMLSEDEVASTQTPAVNIISTLVRDFEITDEKLSSVRYIGTYIFRFKPRDVKRFFAQQGKSVSTVTSQKLLVLPFISRDYQTSIWAPGNQWMQAWNRVPSLSGIVPLEVPLGDISDVRDISDSGAFSYEPNRLQAMLNRYGSQEAVITIATPDEELSRIIDPLAIAKGALKIEIYRTDRGQAELVQEVSATADGVQTAQQLYDHGVILVRSALQKDWKAKTSISPIAASNSIRVVVPITSLSDWMRIQSELKRISSLGAVNVKSLSPTQANVEIEYNGKRERLDLSLAQAGMEIERSTAIDGSPVDVLSKIQRREMRF